MDQNLGTSQIAKERGQLAAQTPGERVDDQDVEIARFQDGPDGRGDRMAVERRVDSDQG